MLQMHPIIGSIHYCNIKILVSNDFTYVVGIGYMSSYVGCGHALLIISFDLDDGGLYYIVKNYIVGV